MKTKLLSLTLALASATGFAGSGSHGGIGAVVGDGIFLLDLVEHGLEARPEVNWGERQQYVSPITTGSDRVVKLVLKGGIVERHVVDGPGLPSLHGYLLKSSSQNNYMFGRALPQVCDTCFTPETQLSIALVNQLPSPQEIGAFRSLKWVMVRAPLKLTDDANSPLPDHVKFMIASREANLVRVAEAGWSKTVNHQGRTLAPLNLANQLALVTHEILYAVTERQGDRDSDRARALNARKYRGYRSDEQSYANTISDNYRLSLNRVPGHPSAGPVYVSELRPGSELVVLRDTPVGGTRSLTLVADYAPMTEELYHANFYPFDKGGAHFFWRHSPFTNFGVDTFPSGHVLKAGTRYRVQAAAVDVGNSDQYTEVDVDPQTNSDLMYFRVKSPRKGTRATITDFQKMIRGTMSLELKPKL